MSGRARLAIAPACRLSDSPQASAAHFPAPHQCKRPSLWGAVCQILSDGRVVEIRNRLVGIVGCYTSAARNGSGVRQANVGGCNVVTSGRCADRRTPSTKAVPPRPCSYKSRRGPGPWWWQLCRGRARRRGEEIAAGSSCRWQRLGCFILCHRTLTFPDIGGWAGPFSSRFAGAKYGKMASPGRLKTPDPPGRIQAFKCPPRPRDSESPVRSHLVGHHFRTQPAPSPQNPRHSRTADPASQRRKRSLEEVRPAPLFWCAPGGGLVLVALAGTMPGSTPRCGKRGN